VIAQQVNGFLRGSRSCPSVDQQRPFTFGLPGEGTLDDSFIVPSTPPAIFSLQVPGE
jgi:hypothetical protein